MNLSDKRSISQLMKTSMMKSSKVQSDIRDLWGDLIMNICYVNGLQR